MSEEINKTLEDMDATLGRVLTGDVGKIVKILNDHEKSLAELQAESRRVEIDIGHINRLLQGR